VDTAIRGGLAVALYVVFPPFSDIHRLWERANGLNLNWPIGRFEYPPLSALYFEPLAALPSSRWAVAINGLVMVAAAVVITWILLRVADWSHSSGADIGMWVASPALLLFLPINWDVLVVLVALLGVVALYRSRTVISGVLHGIGTAFKIFPGALVLPVLPLIEGWRRRTSFLLSGFAVLAVSYISYAAIDPDGWRFHLDFASSRTDIESTIWAILDGGLDVLGVDLSMGVINTLSTVSIGVALLLLTVWVARARPVFAEVAALALTAMLILNKTFKPQYVLWVLPFYAWIRASRAKMRLVEAAAIVAFVVIYFEVPKWINPVETAFRITVLALLAADTIRASSGRGATQAL
jgi:uncharacterized membrane protein